MTEKWWERAFRGYEARLPPDLMKNLLLKFNPQMQRMIKNTLMRQSNNISMINPTEIEKLLKFENLDNDINEALEDTVETIRSPNSQSHYSTSL